MLKWGAPAAAGVATKYRLHKELGALYRQSGFKGTYGEWLRSEVGYTKGGHGSRALSATVARWFDRRKNELAVAEKKGLRPPPASGGSGA